MGLERCQRYQRKKSKGWLDNSGNVTNLNVISKVPHYSCEEECSKNAKCVGYTYLTSSSRCDLKDESGVGGGLKDIDGLIAGLRDMGQTGYQSEMEKGPVHQ